MRTDLDSAKTWFLERLIHTDELAVVVIEYFRGEEAEDIQVSEHLLSGMFPLEPRDESRRLVVRFRKPVACQIVDESYTAMDTGEARDEDGFLQVLSKSPYLDFVSKHHGWFADVAGPAKHYRLWTEDHVIDEAAHDEPAVAAPADDHQA